MFLSFLLNVGDGKLQDFCISLTSLPESVPVCKDVKKLMHFDFPDLGSKYRDEIALSQRAVLRTGNANSEELNNFVSDMTLGSSKQYVSVDKIYSTEEHELRCPVEPSNDISETVSLLDHQM